MLSSYYVFLPWWMIINVLPFGISEQLVFKALKGNEWVHWGKTFVVRMLSEWYEFEVRYVCIHLHMVNTKKKSFVFQSWAEFPQLANGKFKILCQQYIIVCIVFTYGKSLMNVSFFIVVNHWVCQITLSTFRKKSQVRPIT